MSFETQLKSSYAEIHQRLLNPPKPKIVKSSPPAAPPTVIPNLPTEKVVPTPRYTLMRLAEWLVNLENIKVVDIQSKQKPKHVVLARMIFYHLAYKHSSGRFSSADIGRFTNKDHSSVLSGIVRIAHLRQNDRQLDYRLCQYENVLIHEIVESGGDEPGSLCSLCPYR